jgi:hypothetical protein
VWIAYHSDPQFLAAPQSTDAQFAETFRFPLQPGKPRTYTVAQYFTDNPEYLHARDKKPTWLRAVALHQADMIRLYFCDRR